MTDTPKRRWRMTRRGFLIGAGVAGASLALGVGVGLPIARLRIADSLSVPSSGEGGFGAMPTDPLAWFEVTPDNTVSLFVSKAEMGQGIHTALTQIAADELDLAMDEVRLVQGDTSRGPADSSGTGSSSSVSASFVPLRQSAAMLRDMLLTKAATILTVSRDTLTQRGRSFVATDGRTISFGEIVAAPGEWVIPEAELPLKQRADFTLIGQSVPRLDIPAKVQGKAIYGYDMRVDGMQYGAILRPPTFGAKLRRVDADNARKADGVHTVVVDGDFVGVVASSRARAQRAIAALRAEWDTGRAWQQADIDEAVAIGNGGGGVVIQRGGSVSGLGGAGSVSAEYRTPLAVQTPLEGQAALADVRADRATVWCSTQGHELLRGRVAEVTGLEEAQVTITPTYLGGGFGRKILPEVAMEAARLSKAAGIPVHVGWTRAEELRYGFFRPPTHSRLSARLGAQGQIEAATHHQASGDVAFGFLPGFLSVVFGADFGAWRGGRFLYNVPNVEVVSYRRELPMRTGWWRGLGLLANTFAVESFVDELAHAAGVDPLTFRLNHLDASDPEQARVRNALESAAQAAGWGTPVPAGRARGIACSVDVGTVVAEVAEVSYDAASGKVRVHHITAAMDCGMVVNPDGATAQVEGNVMWGVGSTLLEGLTVQDGQVSAQNFDAYPLLTMKEAPDVQTVLLESGDRPYGVGEPAIGPVAAAIANALFALTGVRVRELPFTPARMQAAMAAQELA